MTDNLILVCGVGFGLSLLCNAALVVWILVRKESAKQAEPQDQKGSLKDEIVRLKETHDNEMSQMGCMLSIINQPSGKHDSEIERLKELSLDIVRLKEKINQHDNQMAQMIDEYESEIDRLKELVKPENAIEADFGVQFDDDDDDDLTHLLDDDDEEGKNEEEDDEIKI